MTVPFGADPTSVARWFGDTPPPPPDETPAAPATGAAYSARMVVECTDLSGGALVYRKTFYSDPGHTDEAEAVRQLLSRCMIIEDES
jgi:hypothetical protein